MWPSLTSGNSLVRGIYRVSSCSSSSRRARHLVTCSGTHQPQRFIAPREATTQRLAQSIASDLQPGDCICLYGSVGAGKSVFSRAFIQHALEEPHMPVPSPTYLLQNIYDEMEGMPIHHFDLYRLSTAADLGRLQLADSFATAVCLVEWAERLGPALPREHLAVTLRIMDQEEQSQRMGQMVAGRVGDQAGDQAALGEEDDPYSDRRWREILLQPFGSRWEDRLPGLLSPLLQDVGPAALMLD